MKNVLLMRHAKSSWDDLSLSDHERPLNKRGEKDAPRMGQLLSDIDLLPDIIISSTAKRAKMTVSGLLKTCPFEGEVLYTRELYHADVEDFLSVIKKIDDNVEIVLLISHNPGGEVFLEEICDENEHMPTAAIAHMKLEVAQWSQIDSDVFGELENLWRPKELD